MEARIKRYIIARLASRVWRLRAKHHMTVVAVVGSIGKTSTKFAVAQLLSQKFRVRYQEGNYNVPLSVPFVFFGMTLPSLRNPIAWLITFLRMDAAIRRSYQYDVVVVELGTDGPGQIAEFKEILQPDLAIVTAIAPEHMENFASVRAVATEELSIAQYAKKLLVNQDLCGVYVGDELHAIRYGIGERSAYRIADHTFNGIGGTLRVVHGDHAAYEGSHQAIAIPQLYSLTAAIAVGTELGMTQQDIAAAVNNIRPVNGRMQLLNGLGGSTIIDETYNASPDATKAALTALYDMPGAKKIALLGNMNELGNISSSAHAEIGALCTPDKLQLVVTLGPDANEYLASAAEKQGCKVRRCNTPYEAAACIAPLLDAETVLLAKGSQNLVYAEEAVKQLLADPADAEKLVRQSAYWHKRKARSFENHSAV